MCILAFSGAVPVFADIHVWQEPGSIIYADGREIFFITPRETENEEQLKSGLYYNTNPPENIYYFDDELHEFDNDYLGYDVFSSNGTYFAHTPRSHGLDDRAIGFYKNGSLIKSYSVGDLLLDASKGLFSESHIMWEDNEKREFDAETNILTVTTRDNRVYSFDITTGDMLATGAFTSGDSTTKPDDSSQTADIIQSTELPSSMDPAPIYFALFGIAAVFAATVIMAAILIRKKVRQKRDTSAKS